MEAPGQLPRNYSSLRLGPQPGAEGHSLGEWRHLVSYQEINPVWDEDLSLGLRAILWENGDTWSVTKQLTLSHLMQPGAKAPGQLPSRHHKP